LFGIFGGPNNPILHHKNSQGKKWSVNNNNNNNNDNNMREGPNKKKNHPSSQNGQSEPMAMSIDCSHPLEA
jgi:hypothetical protein